MKREILFRGKRADNGEWVEGYYVNKSPEKHQIVTKKDTFPIQVLPETVGQFTGLTDKNGAKIFDGDILKGGIFLSYEVKWDYEDGGWNITESALNFTVTGNIHDNPELIQS
jgi:hypothetical protein